MDQRHNSTLTRTNYLVDNAKETGETYFVHAQEDMKHYGERYSWDKERSHDTIVDRNNDLVDHTEKAPKALLSEQEDVKHYVLPG